MKVKEFAAKNSLALFYATITLGILVIVLGCLAFVHPRGFHDDFGRYPIGQRGDWQGRQIGQRPNVQVGGVQPAGQNAPMQPATAPTTTATQ